MAEVTGITWTHSTFNPWRGCLRVSEGCELCYAETAAGRNPAVLGVWGSEKGGGTRVVAAEAYWKKPLEWNRRAAAAGRPWRVFCASIADVFERWDGPMQTAQGIQWWKRRNGTWTTSDHYRDTVMLTMDDVRARLFRLIEETPALTWLLLTKRPENVLKMSYDWWCQKVPGHVQQNEGDGRRWAWPANVWMGATTENQANADKRVPILLKIPAALRWLSVEPQLGPVTCRENYADGSGYRDWLTGQFHGLAVKFDSGQTGTGATDDARLPRIGWVITGGESGARNKVRPYNLEWARDLVAECRAARTPVFVKQMGADPTLPMNLADHPDDIKLPIHINDARGRIELKLADGKGGDMAEWPEDLRVQEFPA